MFCLVGQHDHRTAKKLITAIFQVVTKKCYDIIDSKPFFGLLTGGSQARKTVDDKSSIFMPFPYPIRYNVNRYFLP